MADCSNFKRVISVSSRISTGNLSTQSHQSSMSRHLRTERSDMIANATSITSWTAPGMGLGVQDRTISAEHRRALPHRGQSEEANQRSGPRQKGALNFWRVN